MEELKPQFYICMTSGIQGPTTELTPEEIEKIIELARQLVKPWQGDGWSHQGLGTDNFYAYLGHDQAIVALRARMSGFVEVCRDSSANWDNYDDTVGLWAHLAPIASRAMLAWREKLEETPFTINNLI